MSILLAPYPSYFGSAPAFDPEAGLTLSTTNAQGAIGNPGSGVRKQNIVMAGDITLPSSFTGVSQNRCLYEMGGTGRGIGVAFTSDGSNLDYLVVTAGNGGSNMWTSSASSTAFVQIPVSSFTAGDSGTLVWEARIDPGRVRVWWKGTLMATGDTSGGGALESDEWCGSASGGWITNTSENGNYGPTEINPWYHYTSTGGGTASSGLRYYQNQLVTV